ncbi:MAG: 16S rRNA (cytidine(1402)-2'-O)-methyltransferase [Candidatus Magasanikbacteria bacterium]|nr:16S rRNA (cytidine(1402)-2'-O)-methyltransferase [Candidatus Magasanikbacteria bacterium]
MPTGKLFIVATPIGNLADMTFRAIETLKSVDLILCEDTRVTKNLLDRYEIKTPTMSYHQHSDARRVKEIVQMLADGKNIALVTDAGTPGISDPGNMLVKELIKREVQIVPIPGPSAVVAALSVSGFPTDRFTFLGFPPHKNKRQKYFKELAAIENTVVFYESGHRIQKCLGELQEVLVQDRGLVICRELTKKFETLYRTTARKLSELTMDERGEFVIVINAL